MYVILNDELYHHGIKGQKWGVRRFQNADGTRTTAGKQRYYGGSKREEKEAKKREAIKEYSKVIDSYNRDMKKANEVWNEARAKYNSLGPDDVSRMREVSKAERGKGSKDAKEYLDLSNKYGQMSYDAWDRKMEAEKRLGKSVVKAYNKEIKRQEKANKKRYGGYIGEEEPDLKKTKDPKILYDNRDKLSDKELNDKLNRLRKENELKKLSESGKKNRVPKVVVDGGKAILTAYIIKKGTKILDNADVKIMDKLKKVTDSMFLPKFN